MKALYRMTTNFKVVKAKYLYNPSHIGRYSSWIEDGARSCFDEASKPRMGCLYNSLQNIITNLLILIY